MFSLFNKGKNNIGKRIVEAKERVKKDAENQIAADKFSTQVFTRGHDEGYNLGMWGAHLDPLHDDENPDYDWGLVLGYADGRNNRVEYEQHRAEVIKLGQVAGWQHQISGAKSDPYNALDLKNEKVREFIQDFVNGYKNGYNFS